MVVFTKLLKILPRVGVQALLRCDLGQPAEGVFVACLTLQRLLVERLRLGKEAFGEVMVGHPRVLLDRPVVPPSAGVQIAQHIQRGPVLRQLSYELHVLVYRGVQPALADQAVRLLHYGFAIYRHNSLVERINWGTTGQTTPTAAVQRVQRRRGGGKWAVHATNRSYQTGMAA